MDSHHDQQVQSLTYYCYTTKKYGTLLIVTTGPKLQGACGQPLYTGRVECLARLELATYPWQG